MENEDVPMVENAFPQDIECNKIYRSTTTHQSDGRYIVHLPFTPNPPVLEKSKDVVLHRLRQLESRFKKASELYYEYNNTMRDYLNTGHMLSVCQIRH